MDYYEETALFDSNSNIGVSDVLEASGNTLRLTVSYYPKGRTTDDFGVSARGSGKG